MMKNLKHFLAMIALTLFSALALAQKTTLTFIHTDHLGSPIMATNADGSVKWREDYQPFGKQLTQQDTDNNIGYTGHLDDKSLGLTYMQARWYNADVGRFMAVDPVRFVQDNPMSFNRYLYVNNNPYKYNDPDGEFLNFVVGALVGAVGNVVTQHIEMALGVRDEFSWGELAADTAIGAVSSGMSTFKNAGKLAVTADRFNDKLKSADKAIDSAQGVTKEASKKITKSSRKRVKRLVKDLSDDGRQNNGLSQEKTDQLRRIVEKAGGKLRNDGASGVKGSSAGKPHVQTEGFGKSIDNRHIWTKEGVQ